MQPIEIGRIFLDLENPRHDPCENEAQVIDFLCRYENIFPLAKDIVQNGLNPLELLAVIPDEGSGGGKERKQSYVVAEGNRRLCALKLLDDPERAPTKLRKGFEELGANWDGIDTLTCMVFDDRDAVRMWLSRIHEGEQGGIGRSGTPIRRRVIAATAKTSLRWQFSTMRKTKASSPPKVAKAS